jgi:large-conductance mechanosensitive channel
MKNSVIMPLFILLIQNIYCDKDGGLENYAIILVMLSLIIGFYLVCFLPYIIIDMVNKKNELIPPKVENTESNPMNENEIEVKVK